MISYLVALLTTKATGALCSDNSVDTACIGDKNSTDAPCFWAFVPPVFGECDTVTRCNALDENRCPADVITTLSNSKDCIWEGPGSDSYSCTDFDCRFVTICGEEGEGVRFDGEYNCFNDATDGCRAAARCEEVTKNNCADSGFGNCEEPTEEGDFCVTGELHCVEIEDEVGCEEVGADSAIDAPCHWMAGSLLAMDGSCDIATQCDQLVATQCQVNEVTELPDNVDCIGTGAARASQSCENFECKLLTVCGEKGEGFVVGDYNCFNDSVDGCRAAAACEEVTKDNCADSGFDNCVEEDGACIIKKEPTTTEEVTSEEVIGSISWVALTGVGALIVSALF